MFKAGVSLTDISPDKGVGLAGYPHCPRPNKGVHDPLYAGCLYLNDGKNEAVIVTLDLLYIGKQYVKQLRNCIGKNILFVCTHTHSGSWASQVLPSEPKDNISADPDYINTLLEKLEMGILKAMESPFEATIGIGSGYCGSEQGVGGNRREKNGLADPSVNVVAVKDQQNVVRAIMVNYSLHPTFLHADNELVSADYPAYIRRYLSFAYPEAISMFAQGPSGDQSSRYHRVGQDFEEAARVGTTLGVETRRCMESLTFTNSLSIEVFSRETDLPQRELPSLEAAEEAVKSARETYEVLKDGDYIPMRNAELALFGAENTLNYCKVFTNGFESEELPCEIQMVRLNDSLITAIQGELFVEYGLTIKELSPFINTFVFEVSNGALPGYVYTPKAHQEGGYEVGTSMFTPDAGAKIIETVKEMIPCLHLK